MPSPKRRAKLYQPAPDGPSPEQLADWAWHRANLRARLDPETDMATATRLRQEAIAHDDERHAERRRGSMLDLDAR